jgi:hypothetical protein
MLSANMLFIDKHILMHVPTRSPRKIQSGSGCTALLTRLIHSNALVFGRLVVYLP